MPDLPVYDLYAIRYATRDGRRGEHFIGGDPHDGPMPMDYFVWVAVSPSAAFVIDTGFTAATARRRGRTFLRCPVDALRIVGVDPDTVGQVILEAFATLVAHAPALEGIAVRLDVASRR